MIRIAGSTFAFGDISLEDSCDMLVDLGFELADVGASGWSTFTAYVPQQVVQNPDDTEGEADRIKRIMSGKGLGVSELFICDFGQAINHPDAEERTRSRELFARFSAIAGKAGFESVMMLPGNVHEDLGQSYDEAFDTSVQEYKWMVHTAQENGVQLNFEPCIMSIALEPDQAKNLVEAVPGLGCTLDYAHQVQIGLTNAGIEPMHPLANHFHVKQSAEGEFEVKTDAGNGVIDFDRLMRKLKTDDYNGVVTVEFVAAPDVIEAGWDMKVETGKMKKVIEDALAVA